MLCQNEERQYMAMLDLKAHIIMASAHKSAAAAADANEQKTEAEKIYERVFEKSFHLFGVGDIDNWKAANNCVRTPLEVNCYKAAIRILLRLSDAI
jgi:hypothetical protein